ncbi:NAD(P)(+) transhydrogenase (Re/Si-specific) subunit beta [candidate division KSB1 bacterium]|nr:NAD(P)(+) transhydrogenase (Re/Si-specific) subunit beta [candidate division KSB1 bacterium]
MPKEEALVKLLYLAAALLFIFGLKGLAHPRTAVRGNLLAAIGMLLAIVVTLTDKRIVDFRIIIAGLVVGGFIGTFMAYRSPMTAMHDGRQYILVASGGLTEPSELIAFGLPRGGS